MAMCRLNNAEFHKFLSEFSEEVSKGRYKKMPYDKYRTFRNWHGISVDVVLEHYTNLNGDRVQRIRISPDGPTGYEFYIDDGSFGNFCYDYLKKKEEPKVHPDEKKIQYDIFGNAAYDDIFGNASYNSATYTKDETLAQAMHEYYTDKALSSSASSKSISSAQTDGTVTIADIGRLSADKSEIRMVTDIMQDDIDALGERIHEVNARYTDRCNVIEDAAYGAQEMVTKLTMEVDELAKRVDCKADVGAVYSVESDILGKIDELAWEIDHLNGAIEKVKDEMPKVVIQSTSSNCYPVKNYKLKADIMAADDGKEKENMDTSKMFNFDFGPVASNIRMSPYGMAMKNADGKYVSYDKNSGNIMDVEIFNFDAQKFLYKMPVAVNAVAVGDIVVHMRKAMFVSAVNGNRISVVDIYNGEVKDIMPTTSPFGFNFITKVVSLIDMSGANADTPFGNLLPLLMLGEGQDFKDILPMMFLTGNTGVFGNMVQNPLMLYALMGDNGNAKDILPFLLMSQNFGAPAACNCNCHNEENHQ
jgi:hypothetical protein